MLSKVKRNNEKGFTLIELMIVIAIIGILAAIAIPQFSAYRTRSYNSAAEADLRNAATAQEAYYVDKQHYCSVVSSLTGADYGLYLSKNVTLSISAATTSGYIMKTRHGSGDSTFVIKGPGGSVSKR